MLVPDSRIPFVSKGAPLRICVLGSTGSIGTSALEVLRKNPDRFEVVGLAAGANASRLSEQIDEFEPSIAVLATGDATSIESSGSTEVLFGEAAVVELAAHPDVDVVLAAISGSAGLASTVSALKAGKRVALANKESIVCAGVFIGDLLAAYGGSIVPVDSEHSALFQAMQGDRYEDIAKLILTASGGPFLYTPKSKFDELTPELALKHPRWEMGAKITIDSATLMNKALELIEAHWLFAFEPEKIEVVVHPQSIVHSVVAFYDGSQIAQLSHPDMKGPIAYALQYPERRLVDVMEQLSLAEAGSLDFLALDSEKFESIQLARDCLAAGGNASLVFNVANEVAVDIFLSKQMPFSGIYTFVREALDRYASKNPESIEGVITAVESLRSELQARSKANFERAV
jgi:1-deoxy-D-xylulose-5-phosphate reductoisomerase